MLNYVCVTISPLRRVRCPSYSLITAHTKLFFAVVIMTGHVETDVRFEHRRWTQDAFWVILDRRASRGHHIRGCGQASDHDGGWITELIIIIMTEITVFYMAKAQMVRNSMLSHDERNSELGKKGMFGWENRTSRSGRGSNSRPPASIASTWPRCPTPLTTRP